MTKGEEQSLVMSFSFSWLLRVLVISAVLQQGMTAMWTQTPGCPVTALYHPDDRKEKLTAQVSVSVALVSVLAYVTVNPMGVVMIGNILVEKFWCKGVSISEWSYKLLWWKIPELGVTCWECGSGCLVGPMEKPRLPVRVCQLMFLVEWQSTNSSAIWF